MRRGLCRRPCALLLAAGFGLAVLIVAFVERFYFVLRHGLTTVYQAGKQRFYVMICYRGIRGTEAPA